MKKYFILTVISIVLGYLMAKLLFVGYKNSDVIHMSNTSNKYYFVQLGAFSTLESMNENMKLSNYIYINDTNLYYVFGCITKNSENIDKINNHFKSIGYNTYVKEFNISDNDLSNSVDKTDLLISNTNEGIDKLCRESILKYKEG